MKSSQSTTLASLLTSSIKTCMPLITMQFSILLTRSYWKKMFSHLMIRTDLDIIPEVYRGCEELNISLQNKPDSNLKPWTRLKRKSVTVLRRASRMKPYFWTGKVKFKAIEKTFEDAKVPIEKHYSKPNVVPVEVLPIFPDFKMWKYPCAQVMFDSDPAPVGMSVPAQLEEMSQAMIRGVMDESGEQFVAYFLPTESTLEKRRRDFTNCVDYEDEEEYEYKIAREYNWNVKTKASKGDEENYFLVFRQEGVYFNELETRVRLSKRRQKAGQPPNNTRLVVKHRPMDANEFNIHRQREKQLEPHVEEDEDESEEEDEEEEEPKRTENKDKDKGKSDKDSKSGSDSEKEKSDGSDKEGSDNEGSEKGSEKQRGSDNDDSDKEGSRKGGSDGEESDKGSKSDKDGSRHDGSASEKEASGKEDSDNEGSEKRGRANDGSDSEKADSDKEGSESDREGSGSEKGGRKSSDGEASGAERNNRSGSEAGSDSDKREGRSGASSRSSSRSSHSGSGDDD
uniref:RNA polymerase II-associated factor 1 homolog n=1 Tax=Lygus hesperus TaxID=30085 RepID=A0A0K8SDN4_LYGHE